MPQNKRSWPEGLAAMVLVVPLQLLAQTQADSIDQNNRLPSKPSAAVPADDAWQLLRQGNVAQAEATFGALIGRSTTDPDPWLGRGLARLRLKQWDLATQDLEKAVALAPGYADAWSALADVYRWTERPAAAADAYGRLAALRPADAQVQILRARSLQAAGDKQAAALAVQRAREAMYEAKKAGRNRVSTLDTSQD